MAVAAAAAAAAAPRCERARTRVRMAVDPTPRAFFESLSSRFHRQIDIVLCRMSDFRDRFTRCRIIGLERPTIRGVAPFVVDKQLRFARKLGRCRRRCERGGHNVLSEDKTRAMWLEDHSTSYPPRYDDSTRCQSANRGRRNRCEIVCFSSQKRVGKLLDTDARLSTRVLTDAARIVQRTPPCQRSSRNEFSFRQPF